MIWQGERDATQLIVLDVITDLSCYDEFVKKPAKKTPAAAAKKPKRQRAHVSVNQLAAEPMQILGNVTHPPEVGEVLKVLPDRLQSTVFAKTVKVDRITVEGGVTTIYATTF